jgi:hypothetical protein
MSSESAASTRYAAGAAAQGCSIAQQVDTASRRSSADIGRNGSDGSDWDESSSSSNISNSSDGHEGSDSGEDNGGTSTSAGGRDAAEWKPPFPVVGGLTVAGSRMACVAWRAVGVAPQLRLLDFGGGGSGERYVRPDTAAGLQRLALAEAKLQDEERARAAMVGRRGRAQRSQASGSGVSGGVSASAAVGSCAR